jgi:DNA polymerase-3 subunit beta
MKFTATAGSLVSAVNWTAGALASKPALPVLAGMTLTAEGSKVRFGAFDCSVAMTGTAPAEVGEPGSVMVHGATLQKILRTLPDSGTVTVSDTDGRVMIRCGRSQRVMPPMVTDEYPPLPAATLAAGTVSSSDLAEMAKAVACAAARIDKNEALAAIRLRFGPETLELTATDRYRIADGTITLADPVADTPDVVVRATSFAAMAAHLPAGERVRFSTAAGEDGKPALLGVTCAGWTFTCEVLPAAYPEAVDVWAAREASAAATCDTVPLLDAVNRAIAVPLEEAGGVTVTFRPNGIDVRGDGQEGYDADEPVEGEITYDGATVSYCFNPEFLVAGVNGIADERGLFEVLTMGGIRITANRDAPVAYRYIVMPKRTPGS